MSMKNGFLLFFAIIALISSCKKYPEGPGLTIRTNTHRLVNVWKVEKVLLNNSDVTSSFTSINYTETYDKDGNYSFNSTIGNGSGRWVFENNDTQIKRNGVSNQSSATLTILRLKEKSFWYTMVDGSDTYEFHFIPNE